MSDKLPLILIVGAYFLIMVGFMVDWIVDIFRSK